MYLYVKSYSWNPDTVNVIDWEYAEESASVAPFTDTESAKRREDSWLHHFHFGEDHF
jgi:hypothetical protein